MKRFSFEYIPLLFILLYLPQRLQAQFPAINFKHLSYREGLVQSPISTFLQDDQGFIWFGSVKGLTRYDGYEFKTFVHSATDTNSISNNIVNAVFMDHAKNIWIGTANGLNKFNRDLEIFESIDILEIKGGRNYISCITEDQQHNIWVGTFAGLKKLNKTTQKIEDIPAQNPVALKGGVVFTLFSDKENVLWVGSKNGLQKFDPVTQRNILLPEELRNSATMSAAKILAIRQDQKGDLWFGTESSGVICFHVEKNFLEEYTSKFGQTNCILSNWIKDILVYDDNTLWFATQNGLSILDTKANRFTNYQHDIKNENSLSDNATRALMKDRASCVWVGTFSGGIDFYYKGNSNFISIGEATNVGNGFLHPLVNAVSEDLDGSLWVGTYGGGLAHVNAARNSIEYFSVKSPKDGRSINGVMSMALDGNDKLWVGGLEGLSLFNKNLKKFIHYQIPMDEGKLSGKLINCILPDKGGVWIATNGAGLKYFKDEKVNTAFLNEDSEHSLADNFVTELLADTLSNMWVGTQNGLNYFDKSSETFTVYKKVRETKFQLSHNHITCLFKDSNRRLWIGTEDGLNYFDAKTKKFYELKITADNPDNFIHAIVEDKLKNIWVSTDQGLIKLIFKKFRVPFNENDYAVTQYTSNDGLASNQFSNKAGILLRTHELAFGGLNGLSIFSPAKIVTNTQAPTVNLTEILINNKKVPVSAEPPLTQSIAKVKEIVLRHDHGLVSFKFAALNYINPEKNQYAYRLEGLPNGDQWQDIGNQRLVNFTNLPAGTYTFMIRASNDNKIWSDQIRSLKLIVLPPWWKTWWAYTIYLLLIACFILAIISLLEYRRKMRTNLFMEQLQNERQQELYQMKLNFFTNVSHEIRTPLTLILGPVEKLLNEFNNEGAANQQLLLIKNNASRLMKLVTELLDFRKAESGSMNLRFVLLDLVPFCEKIFDYFEGLAVDKNIKYKFECTEESIPMYFDPDQLEKVVFNILSNAFKFTPDHGEIIFKVMDAGDHIHIQVTDNGNGIPQHYQDQLFKNFFQIDESGKQHIGSGVGLALSKSIVELHKGKLTFISKPANIQERGLTTFTVSLQKGKAHLDSSLIFSDGNYTNQHLDVTSSSVFDLNETDLSTATNEKRFTVFIAEDNPEVRSFLADTLKQHYIIVEFDNGASVLKFMENEIPDLVISDIMMPGMDGLTLCTNIKSTESTNHIPVILLTARAAVSHQVEGLATGADAYISKPFSTQILELTIKNLLMAKEIMREKFSQQLVLQPTNIPLDSPEEKFIAKLMAIIESRMDSPEFDVNMLVTEIGISRSVLYKKVQTLTNYSVADLIKEMRLKKAAELFKRTSMTISDVAFAVGFNDRKYFSKEFRKQFNMSPSEFIDQWRGANSSF